MHTKCCTLLFAMFVIIVPVVGFEGNSGYGVDPIEAANVSVDENSYFKVIVNNPCPQGTFSCGNHCCPVGSHCLGDQCVENPTPILLEPAWTVKELSPTARFDGTWTRRPGTNTFDASWNKGAITDVINITSIQGNNIVLHRQTNNGYYIGTISPDGKSISGTASWYKPGSRWSASIPSSLDHWR